MLKMNPLPFFAALLLSLLPSSPGVRAADAPQPMPSQLYNLDCIAYESVMRRMFTIWPAADSSPQAGRVSPDRATNSEITPFSTR